MKFEVTTEQLRKYSLFVGVPMYGGNCTGMFCQSTNLLSTLCAKYGIELKFHYLFNESLITRARTYIVDEFLRSEFTHLMFIDADIGFNPNDVISLLAIQVTDSEKYNIVAGPYPKKAIDWSQISDAVKLGLAEDDNSKLKFYGNKYAFNMVSGTTLNISEPTAVLEAGTGFMLIPRNVFEKFDAAYPELRYLPDHVGMNNFDGSREITLYFDCEIEAETRRYLSEDYFFCRKVSRLGVNIHICPWMELKHVGTYIFHGSITAQANIVAARNNSNLKKENKSKKNLTRR
jgi:hypothetical protein